ncbi:acyl-CoA reductase [Algicola sagamiensis]|uniref:acyl-CoA reductase n=1 Tax=Algicola sagamiensis TaxID=163869 RepID=UPI000361D4D2|nr:acyl-CoA reductase [Algicola sagamiensis]
MSNLSHFAEIRTDADIETMYQAIASVQTERFPLETLYQGCQHLSELLFEQSDFYQSCFDALLGTRKFSEKEVHEALAGLQFFLQADALKEKVKREYGTTSPFCAKRVSFEENHFEAFQPLGLLGHILPSNDPVVGVLSIIEGLLSQNINVVKLSSQAGAFPFLFFTELNQTMTDVQLNHWVYLLCLSSKQTNLLKYAFHGCDAMAVWGGEAAVEGARKILPKHAELIDWGPKISFAYIADLGQMTQSQQISLMEKLSEEICLNDQRACSAPQCIFIDTDNEEMLLEFAQLFSKSLDKVSLATPPQSPDEAEKAEISIQTRLLELEKPFGNTTVIKGEQADWRIFVDTRELLETSPLYRTIWIRPLQQKKIVTVLKPFRAYLQTVGLVCQLDSFSNISQRMLAAGVTRVNAVGQMQEAYMGAPHDGRYALRAYTRRVSYQLGDDFSGMGDLVMLQPQLKKDRKGQPILTKEGFQSLQIEKVHQQLVFKSGGSTGQSKFSYFTYDDYYAQMEAAGMGLLASGFEPTKDHAMNLFYGGALYGGFISFFTILEQLNAKQYPMTAHEDFEFVADCIIEFEINTLLGMPSYLMQLLQSQKEKLQAYGGLQKVFYGGEHFNQQQRQWLQDTFGISLIRSATYGSVDAGPLGYQCGHCEGGEHHLHQQLHDLEILDLEEDKSVSAGEIGRLIVSSKCRTGQRIERYDIGDLGRFVNTPCACGRAAPKFELLGRHGDVFRIATYFINYQKIAQILEKMDYPFEFQMVLETRADMESIEVHLDEHSPIEKETVKTAIFEQYEELNSACNQENMLKLSVEKVNPLNFQRTAGSGKLQRVVDLREHAK